MSADQFLTVDGRPTVRVERRYPHPIDKVWRAVTTPEHLGQWFPSPVDVDLSPGGSMRFGAFGGTDAASGTVEVVDAPRLLVFTWGADRLTFELATGRRRDHVRPHALVRRTHCGAELRHRLGAVSQWASQPAGRRAAAGTRPRHRPTRGVGS